MSYESVCFKGGHSLSGEISCGRSCFYGVHVFMMVYLAIVLFYWKRFLTGYIDMTTGKHVAYCGPTHFLPDLCCLYMNLIVCAK